MKYKASSVVLFFLYALFVVIIAPTIVTNNNHGCFVRAQPTSVAISSTNPEYNKKDASFVEGVIFDIDTQPAPINWARVSLRNILWSPFIRFQRVPAAATDPTCRDMEIELINVSTNNVDFKLEGCVHTTILVRDSNIYGRLVLPSGVLDNITVEGSKIIGGGGAGNNNAVTATMYQASIVQFYMPSKTQQPLVVFQGGNIFVGGRVDLTIENATIAAPPPPPAANTGGTFGRALFLFGDSSSNGQNGNAFYNASLLVEGYWSDVRVKSSTFAIDGAALDQSISIAAVRVYQWSTSTIASSLLDVSDNNCYASTGSDISSDLACFFLHCPVGSCLVRNNDATVVSGFTSSASQSMPPAVSALVVNRWGVVEMVLQNLVLAAYFPSATSALRNGLVLTMETTSTVYVSSNNNAPPIEWREPAKKFSIRNVDIVLDARKSMTPSSALVANSPSMVIGPVTLFGVRAAAELTIKNLNIRIIKLDVVQPSAVGQSNFRCIVNGIILYNVSAGGGSGSGNGGLKVNIINATIDASEVKISAFYTTETATPKNRIDFGAILLSDVELDHFLVAGGNFALAQNPFNYNNDVIAIDGVVIGRSYANTLIGNISTVALVSNTWTMTSLFSKTMTRVFEHRAHPTEGTFITKELVFLSETWTSTGVPHALIGVYDEGSSGPRIRIDNTTIISEKSVSNNNAGDGMVRKFLRVLPTRGIGLSPAAIAQLEPREVYLTLSSVSLFVKQADLYQKLFDNLLPTSSVIDLYCSHVWITPAAGEGQLVTELDGETLVRTNGAGGGSSSGGGGGAASIPESTLVTNYSCGNCSIFSDMCGSSSNAAAANGEGEGGVVAVADTSFSFPIAAHRYKCMCSCSLTNRNYSFVSPSFGVCRSPTTPAGSYMSNFESMVEFVGPTTIAAPPTTTSMSTSTTPTTTAVAATCSPGRYGTTGCVVCPENTYCPGGTTDPVPCPPGTWTMGQTGRNDVSYCVGTTTTMMTPAPPTTTSTPASGPTTTFAPRTTSAPPTTTTSGPTPAPPAPTTQRPRTATANKSLTVTVSLLTETGGGGNSLSQPSSSRSLSHEGLTESRSIVPKVAFVLAIPVPQELQDTAFYFTSATGAANMVVVQQLQRNAALLKIVRCGQDGSQPLSAAANPTGMTIGSDWLQHHRGAVVSNTVIGFAMTALYALALPILMAVKKMTAREAILKLRFPSYIIVPLSIIAAPTAISGAVLFWYGNGAADVMLMVFFGLFLPFVPFAVLVSVYYAHRAHKFPLYRVKTQTKQQQQQQQQQHLLLLMSDGGGKREAGSGTGASVGTGSGESCKTKFLHWWYWAVRPTKQWPEKHSFIIRWYPVLYPVRHAWFPALDWMTTISISILSGLASSITAKLSTCIGVSVTTLVLLVAHLFVLVWFRPTLSRMSTSVQILLSVISILNSVLSTLILVGSSIGDAMSGLAATESAVAIVGGIFAGLDLAIEAYEMFMAEDGENKNNKTGDHNNNNHGGDDDGEGNDAPLLDFSTPNSPSRAGLSNSLRSEESAIPSPLLQLPSLIQAVEQAKRDQQQLQDDEQQAAKRRGLFKAAAVLARLQSASIERNNRRRNSSSGSPLSPSPSSPSSTAASSPLARLAQFRKAGHLAVAANRLGNVINQNPLQPTESSAVFEHNQFGDEFLKQLAGDVDLQRAADLRKLDSFKIGEGSLTEEEFWDALDAPNNNDDGAAADQNSVINVDTFNVGGSPSSDWNSEGPTSKSGLWDGVDAGDRYATRSRDHNTRIADLDDDARPQRGDSHLYQTVEVAGGRSGESVANRRSELDAMLSGKKAGGNSSFWSGKAAGTASSSANDDAFASL